MNCRLNSLLRVDALRRLGAFQPSPWIVRCFLMSGLLLGACLPVQAQSGVEIEIIERPSDMEIQRFLNKHVPEGVPLLAQIKRDEGEEAYLELLEECALTMMAFEETRAYDGEAAASNYLSIVRTEFLIENDIVEYFKPKQTPERMSELRKQVIDRTSTLRKLEMKALTFELESTRALVQEIEGAIVEHEAVTKTDVVNHVDELLSDELYVNPETKEAAAMREQLPETWHTEMEAAQKVQEESGKPMVMLISAAWCPPCHQLIKDVLGAAKVEFAVERIVPLYIDGERLPGLLRKHRVRSVPTFLALDKNGRVYSRLSGLPSKGELARWLGKVVRKAP